jgi:hypothetical protein
MSLAITTRVAFGSRQVSTDPDSDVRAAAAQPGRKPHGVRLRALARSLLSLKIVPVVLLSLVSSMSACVVPVAPKFQDPPGEPNIAPYIVSASPDFGTFVPVLTQDFQVTVTDQNVGDTLYYQWVIDYPPFNTGTTRPLSVQQIKPTLDGTQLLATRSQGITCGLNPAPTLAVHQLEFIVADQPFDPAMPRVLDAVKPNSGGLVARASWTFQISCP